MYINTMPAAKRNLRMRRSRGARVFVFAAIVYLLTALVRLQVVEGEQYALTAKNNRLRELPVPAPRGTIYDRHGRVVAENIPGYSIQLMPSHADSMAAQIERLKPVLGLSDAEVERGRRRWQRQRHLPLVLMADAPESAVAALAERHHQFPTVIVSEYARRHYPAGGAAAHFLGYIGEVSEAELELERFAGYQPGRLVGKAGLERQYEEWLAGEPGKRFLEVDAWGRIQRWLSEDLGQRPVPGRDLHLHLDLDLQEYIADIFPREYTGAIVALDPQTGGVLAYYSHPTYDVNDFIGGISTERYSALMSDPERPLLDRVVASTQPAASTWKLAVAGMALDMGIVAPDEYMPQACTGSYFYGRTARCWYAPGHGRQNLIDAIQNSCNVYFYQLGARMGLERFLATGMRMGFSERTGIDVPHEVRPNFPDGPDWYRRRWGYMPQDNEVLNLAIGQGPINMTIIKVAHIYAALTAPGGRVPAPRLAHGESAPQDTFEFRTTARDRWFLEAGMRRVVAPGGTAALSRLAQWDFIGKTGTAQNPHGKSHAWFVGTGAREPGGPPEIAITMFLEHAEHGYTASGYVAEAVSFYLDRKYGLPYRRWNTPRHRAAHGLPYDGQALQAPVVDPPMPGGH
ncbi:MAG TPA: penicillin-binding protein 2 [Longimicrobiales bacterium]|nr:penicillin-binding protein 2 [Longimicrobiales bacterium]